VCVCGCVCAVDWSSIAFTATRKHSEGATGRRKNKENRTLKEKNGGSRFEVRGSRLEVRGSRFEARGQRLEGRGSRAEARGQRAEARGQRSEGRGQRVEGRGQNAYTNVMLTCKHGYPGYDDPTHRCIGCRRNLPHSTIESIEVVLR
jgi:hypothetical protein